MGGGGGGGYRGVGDVNKLLQEAKERLRDAGRKNIFISFAYEDADEVNLLRGQAKNDNSEIEFNDWSVKSAFDSEQAAYIKRQITERINQSSLAVVYISENTNNSRWVNWEVEKALELGKKVVAVHKGEKPPKSTPSSVQKNNVRIIKWKDLHKEL